MKFSTLTTLTCGVILVSSQLLAQQSRPLTDTPEKGIASAEPEPAIILATRYRVFATESWDGCRYDDARKWAKESLELSRSIRSSSKQEAYDVEAARAAAEKLLKTYTERLAENRRTIDEAGRDISRHHLIRANDLLELRGVASCDPAATILRKQVRDESGEVKKLVEQATSYRPGQYDYALPLLDQARHKQDDYPGLDRLKAPYQQYRSEVISGRVWKTVKYVVIIGGLSFGAYEGWKIYQKEQNKTAGAH